jgi:hypothetical protein
VRRSLDASCSSLLSVRPFLSITTPYPQNTQSMVMCRLAQTNVDAPLLLGTSLCAASPEGLYLMPPLSSCRARPRHGSTAASSSSSSSPSLTATRATRRAASLEPPWTPEKSCHAATDAGAAQARPALLQPRGAADDAASAGGFCYKGRRRLLQVVSACVSAIAT